MSDSSGTSTTPSRSSLPFHQVTEGFGLPAISVKPVRLVCVNRSHPPMFYRRLCTGPPAGIIQIIIVATILGNFYRVARRYRTARASGVHCTLETGAPTPMRLNRLALPSVSESKLHFSPKIPVLIQRSLEKILQSMFLIGPLSILRCKFKLPQVVHQRGLELAIMKTTSRQYTRGEIDDVILGNRIPRWYFSSRVELLRNSTASYPHFL